MERNEALELLKGGPKGIKEWNRRRSRNEPIPKLDWANLVNADLSHANLFGAYLNTAFLSGAFLYKANLRWANLQNASIRGATLIGADLKWVDLSQVDTFQANFKETDLGGVNFTEGKLRIAHYAKVAQITLSHDRLTPEEKSEYNQLTKLVVNTPTASEAADEYIGKANAPLDNALEYLFGMSIMNYVVNQARALAIMALDIYAHYDIMKDPKRKKVQEFIDKMKTKYRCCLINFHSFPNYEKWLYRS